MGRYQDQKISSMAGELREIMTKTAFGEKTDALLEVAGLGMLGAPAIAELRKKPGKLVKYLRTGKGIAHAEILGLGTLATPSISALAKRRRKKGEKKK